MVSRGLIAVLMAGAVAQGCAHDGPFEAGARDGWVTRAVVTGPAAAPIDGGPGGSPWGEPVLVAADLKGPVSEAGGPYLLDTGDRLRIFVYGQPNLSRVYPVDHGGKIVVPLIGQVRARGRSVYQLAGAIRDRLAAEYVRDPHVTVDVIENRPFFILGEVRNAGQYPFVSGMTVETAAAIAGGYAERADEREVRITRRNNGLVEVIEAPSDYPVQPGDTIYVRERFF